MNIPFDEILAVVREGGDFRTSFDALRNIGKGILPCEAWDNVLTPDVESDESGPAQTAFTSGVSTMATSGIWLGLPRLVSRELHRSRVHKQSCSGGTRAK